MDILISITEAARLMGQSADMLEEHIKSGQLKSYEVGGVVKVNTADVVQLFLNSLSTIWRWVNDSAKEKITAQVIGLRVFLKQLGREKMIDDFLALQAAEESAVEKSAATN